MLNLQVKDGEGILFEDRFGTPMAVMFHGKRHNRFEFSSGPLNYIRTKHLTTDKLKLKLKELGETPEHIDKIIGLRNNVNSK